jgi:hypothetical protein
MGAPETELIEHIVGIAHKVAIGKEQQLDDVPAGRFRRIAAGLPLDRLKRS